MSTKRILTVVLLLGTRAFAQAVNPTEATPVAPKVESLGVYNCDIDPKCRLERFRAQLAAQRRQEYLRRVAEAAVRMERRINKAKPWRTRYNFEVDFAYQSNFMHYGAVLAYAPTYWLKLEAFLGAHDTVHRAFDENTFNDVRWKGVAMGTSFVLLPVKFPLSPYFSTGWGWRGGGATASGFTRDPEGGFGSAVSSQGKAEGHYLMLGVGAALVVPYFHVSAGYQFAYAFHLDAFDRSEGRDESLRDAMRQAVNANYHGGVVEVGCAF